MQRDLKIGLSLAVLLLGVVGALFFRRDDAEAAGYPELQNQEQWNRQIAEKTRSPYLDADFGKSVRKKPASDATPPAAASQWQDEETPAAETTSPAASTTERPSAYRVRQEQDTETPPSREASDPAEFPRQPAAKPLAKSPARRIPPVTETQELPQETIDSWDDQTPRTKNAEAPTRNKTTAPARKPIQKEVAPPIPQNSIDRTLAGDEGFDTSPKAVTPRETTAPAPKAATPKAAGIPTDGKAQSSTDSRSPMINPTAAPQGNLPRMFIPTKNIPFAMTPPVTPRRVSKALDEEPADALETNPAQTQKSTARVYRIRSGDSLQRIAEREYGDRRKVTDIYEANRDTLENPHKLREGDDLVLP